MAPASPASGGRGRLSIGEVLNQLRPDFPEVTISKIRFLEAEGLVAPERTSAGYRRFSTVDVERLRYVLSAQRDHYYPLRVIKAHLDALERGLEPPATAGQSARAPQPAGQPAGQPPRVLPAAQAGGARTGGEGAPGLATAPAGELRLSLEELAANSDLDENQLAQLTSFGLIKPRPGTEHFDAEALLICRTADRLAAFGLEPRHLRPFKTSADREVGLIDQVVRPLARGRDGAAQARAAEIQVELVDLCVTLHAALMRAGLSPRGEVQQ